MLMQLFFLLYFRHPQSASKMTAIKKKVHLNDAVEEDFLTASSDSDTNESAPGKDSSSLVVFR